MIFNLKLQYFNILHKINEPNNPYHVFSRISKDISTSSETIPGAGEYDDGGRVSIVSPVASNYG